MSFIETSALDATNVELAFQNILTGNPTTIYSTNSIFPSSPPDKTQLTERLKEIYRIVSSKALENGNSGQNPLGDRKVVEITKSQDADAKQKCC